jgi:hypothetical protein
MKRNLFIATIIILPLLSGCAIFTKGSTPEAKANEVRALCYAASSIGTSAALNHNSTFRPRFELALVNLSRMVDSKTITGQQLREILASLPVNELKSDTARIAIESATMLFDTMTGKPVDLEQAPYVLAAASGIRDGMMAGLGQ